MKVILSKYAWDKLTAYVDNCPYEIGGLGKVTTDGENFYVSDVEIFTQKVTPAHVEMTADTLATFQVEKMRAKESLVDYKFWWHSHAKMGVFWSGTDTDTMNGSTEFPWLVSLVTNHKHELKARIDIYTPVHVHVDNVTVEVAHPINQTLIDECIADIAQKVTYPAPVTSYAGYGYGAGLLPRKAGTPMANLLDREYYVGDDDYERPKNTLTQSQSDKLSEMLVELEAEYDELAGAKQTPKTKAKMAKLTKRMDNIAYQLDMMTV